MTQQNIYRGAISERLLEMLNVEDGMEPTTCGKKNCCKKYKKKGRFCKKCPKV